jgi:hypothetical protein
MPRTDKLSTYRTTWFDNGDFGGVTYINTNIVQWRDGIVTLDSGGWETVTTKRKINQASRQFALGYTVYQRDYKWFVDTPEKSAIPFFDAIQFKVNRHA